MNSSDERKPASAQGFLLLAKSCHLEIPPLILIIEDEIPARSFLITSLMHAGFRVSRAATGCRGLGEFAMQRPDAVVLDLGLPDIAGSEVVRQVRERSSVPILALSAGSDPGEVAAARDAGANDVMAKPVEAGELLARLKRLMGDPLHVESQPAANSIQSRRPQRGPCRPVRLPRRPRSSPFAHGILAAGDARLSRRQSGDLSLPAQPALEFECKLEDRLPETSGQQPAPQTGTGSRASPLCADGEGCRVSNGG